MQFLSVLLEYIKKPLTRGCTAVGRRQRVQCAMVLRAIRAEPGGTPVMSDLRN